MLSAEGGCIAKLKFELEHGPSTHRQYGKARFALSITLTPVNHFFAFFAFAFFNGFVDLGIFPSIPPLPDRLPGPALVALDDLDDLSIAARRFFFASLRATRSASLDLASFLSVTDSPERRAPSVGSPCGLRIGVAFDFVGVLAGFAVFWGRLFVESDEGGLGLALALLAVDPDMVLHRWTRRVRRPKDSFSADSASTSSTHSTSFRAE